VSSRHRNWLLTGGIGSGKSEVRRLLDGPGLLTIDADSIGHSVLVEEGFGAVSARWPQVVIDGAIDRKSLAAIVFHDRAELAELEALTHPLIFGRIRAESEGFTGIVVVEMPLIDPDLGWPSMVVDANDETRIERAVTRGMGRAEVESRMASQPTRGEWLASADLVIPNHGSLLDLEETVENVRDFLLR
jgi:dephospho-CoA kinase